MRKIWMIVIGLAIACAGRAESPRIVDQVEFNKLWRIAPERMAATYPPLAMETGPLIRKYREIWVDQEFLLDAEGKPSEYKFHGIEPADVDPRPFMAEAMFFRYRPVDGVPATPVRYRDRAHFYMPKPETPSGD